MLVAIVVNNLESLQGSLRQMLTWFLSPKSLGLEHDGEHAVDMVANHLSEGYSVLDQSLRRDLDIEVEIPSLDEFEYRGEDEDYLAPVLNLGAWAKTEVSQYLTDFMVHGSLATLDYSKGWSDFDTFLIVTRDSSLDGRALKDLRKKLLGAYGFLTSIDPLQHHGFLVCTEIDLRNYYEDIMPLVVLQKAKSYFWPTVLRLNPIIDVSRERNNLASRARFFRQAGAKGVMEHHGYKNTYLQSHYQNSENGLFQLKYLLSTGALAPSYFAGAIGEPALKRDAIERVRPLLSESQRRFLDSTTRVRDEWPKREVSPYRGNRIPDWVKEYVEPDYIVNLATLLTELEQLLMERL